MPTSNAASVYLSTALLNHVFKKAAYSQPTNIFVALFDNTASEAQLDAGNLTGELVIGSNGYTRKQIAAEFGTAASGQITNASEILFDTASGAWNDVYLTAIMDAATAGNVLYYGRLENAPVSVGNGETFKFNPSNWTASLT